MAEELYMLMVCYDTVACFPLLGFDNERDANLLRDAANKYNLQRPHPPECTDNSKECDKEWDEFNEKIEAWAAKHPIFWKSSLYLEDVDEYSVHELKMATDKEKIDGKVYVKDVKEYIKQKLVLYAERKGRKFYIRLHAAPGVERYVIVDDVYKKGFIKLGDAVRYFNNKKGE